MYQIGLLLLTGPLRLIAESISQYLKCASKNVTGCLYVKLEPEISRPQSKSNTTHLKNLSIFIPLVYNKASSFCRNLDVRVVLSESNKRKAESHVTSNFDIVMTNSKEENRNISHYVDSFFKSKCDNIIKLSMNELTPLDDTNNTYPPEFRTFKTVCLGGTFDRLHNGHKVLLSEAALRATDKLIVGVTDGSMLKRKVLSELIEPVQKRISDVTKFLQDVDPSLHYDVVPIVDPYGPTITDPDIDCIVVSAETKLGGMKVNTERKNRGMSELVMHVVDLVENTDKIPGEEEKLSSSTGRMHILGTCLKEPQTTSNEFYTILLQGQPLTGKSCISTYLEKYGAVTIYCSEIIKTILNINKDLKELFCDKLNCKLSLEDGTLDYKKLISVCLNNKEKRHWVAQNLAEKVNVELRQQCQLHHEQGMKLIIIHDSVLLEENWICRDINELWSTIMPAVEIIKRIKNFYDLSEENATEAVGTLPNNEQYIAKCHRIFCTLWSDDITEHQVSRAWSDLESKLL